MSWLFKGRQATANSSNKQEATGNSSPFQQNRPYRASSPQSTILGNSPRTGTSSEQKQPTGTLSGSNSSHGSLTSHHISVGVNSHSSRIFASEELQQLLLSFVHYEKAALQLGDNLDHFIKIVHAFLSVCEHFSPRDILRHFHREAVKSFTQHVGRFLALKVHFIAKKESTVSASLLTMSFFANNSNGKLFLQALYQLIAFGDLVVEPVCSSTLGSTMVKSFYLFLDLPVLPSSGGGNNSASTDPSLNLTLEDVKHVYSTFKSILLHLFSFQRITTEIMRTATNTKGDDCINPSNDLTLLFDMVTTPDVPSQNACWQELARELLQIMYTKASVPRLLTYSSKTQIIGQIFEKLFQSSLLSPSDVAKGVQCACVCLDQREPHTSQKLLATLTSCHVYHLAVDYLLAQQHFFLESNSTEQNQKDQRTAIDVPDQKSLQLVSTNQIGSTVTGGCSKLTALRSHQIVSSQLVVPGNPFTSQQEATLAPAIDTIVTEHTTLKVEKSFQKNPKELSTPVLSTTPFIDTPCKVGENQLKESIIMKHNHQNHEQLVKSSYSHSFDGMSHTEACQSIISSMFSLVYLGDKQIKISKVKDQYQSHDFIFPHPGARRTCVHNLEVVQHLVIPLLQRIQAPILQEMILKALLDIISRDSANYFILEDQSIMDYLLDNFHVLTPRLKATALKILEYAVCSLNYIPSSSLQRFIRLISDGKKETTQICLQTIIKLRNFNPRLSGIFRQLGVLEVLIELLHEIGQLASVNTCSDFERTASLQKNALSLPPEDILLMECFNLLLDSTQNILTFRELDGLKPIVHIISCPSYRWHALRVFQQVILHDEPNQTQEHFNTLFNLIQASTAADVSLCVDILQCIIRIMTMESRTKDVFRQAHGFLNVVHLLVMLSAAAPSNESDSIKAYEEVKNNHFDLFKGILKTITCALQENNLNRISFAHDVRYETLTNSIRVAGLLDNKTAKKTFDLLFLMASEAFDHEQDIIHNPLVLQNGEVVAKSIIPLLALCSGTDIKFYVLQRLRLICDVPKNLEMLSMFRVTSRLLRLLQQQLIDPEDELHDLSVSLILRLSQVSTLPADLRFFLRMALPKPYRVNDMLRDPLSIPERNPLMAASSSLSEVSELEPDDNENFNSKYYSDTLIHAGKLSFVSHEQLKMLVTIAESQSTGSTTPCFEFDLRKPWGYACVFIPSVAQISKTSSSSISTSPGSSRQTLTHTYLTTLPHHHDDMNSTGNTTRGSGSGVSTTTTNGHTARFWPPLNGMTLSLWVRVEQWGLDNHPLRLFTLFLPTEPESVLFSVEVDPNNSFVVVSTTDKAIFTEAVISTDKWHHVVVVIKGKPKSRNTVAAVYVDGLPKGVQKLTYPETGPASAANSDVQCQVCARVGTPRSNQLFSPLIWKAASIQFIEEPLDNSSILLVRQLGPSYTGHVQALSLSAFQGWPFPTRDSHPPIPLPEDIYRVSTRLPQGLPLLDMDSVILSFRQTDKVWLSVRGTDVKYISAATCLDMMGGAVAGRAFSLNANVTKGNSLIPSTCIDSVINGVLRPPYAHLVGNVRVFFGHCMAESMAQVGGIDVLIQLIDDAPSTDYLRDAVTLLVQCVMQSPSIAQALFSRESCKVLACTLMKKGDLVDENVILQLMYLCVVHAQGTEQHPLIASAVALRDLFLLQDVWRSSINPVRLVILQHILALCYPTNHNRAFNVQVLLHIDIVHICLMIICETNQGTSASVRAAASTLLSSVLVCLCSATNIQRVLELASVTCERYAHTGIVASEDNGQEIAATSTASSVVPNNMEFLLQSDTLQGDPSNTSKPAPESDIVNVVSADRKEGHFISSIIQAQEQVLAVLVQVSTNSDTLQLILDIILRSKSPEWLLGFIDTSPNPRCVGLALRLLFTFLQSQDGMFLTKFRAIPEAFDLLGALLSKQVLVGQLYYLIFAMYYGVAMKSVPEFYEVKISYLNEIFSDLPQDNSSSCAINACLLLFECMRALYQHLLITCNETNNQSIAFSIMSYRKTNLEKPYSYGSETIIQRDRLKKKTTPDQESTTRTRSFEARNKSRLSNASPSTQYSPPNINTLYVRSLSCSKQSSISSHKVVCENSDAGHLSENVSSRLSGNPFISQKQDVAQESENVSSHSPGNPFISQKQDVAQESENVSSPSVGNPFISQKQDVPQQSDSLDYEETEHLSPHDKSPVHICDYNTSQSPTPTVKKASSSDNIEKTSFPSADFLQPLSEDVSKNPFQPSAGFDCCGYFSNAGVLACTLSSYLLQLYNKTNLKKLLQDPDICERLVLLFVQSQKDNPETDTGGDTVIFCTHPSHHNLLGILAALLLDTISKNRPEKAVVLIDRIVDTITSRVSGESVSQYFHSLWSAFFRAIVDSDMILHCNEPSSQPLMTGLSKILLKLSSALCAFSTENHCVCAITVFMRFIAMIIDCRNNAYQTKSSPGDGILSTAYTCLTCLLIRCLQSVMTSSPASPANTASSLIHTACEQSSVKVDNHPDVESIADIVLRTLEQKSVLFFGSHHKDQTEILCVLNEIFSLTKHPSPSTRDLAQEVLLSFANQQPTLFSQMMEHSVSVLNLDRVTLSGHMERSRSSLVAAFASAQAAFFSKFQVDTTFIYCSSNDSKGRLWRYTGPVFHSPSWSERQARLLRIKEIMRFRAQKICRIDEETFIERLHQHRHRELEITKLVLEAIDSLRGDLFRERGLWGPEQSSHLDKWELDNNEGMHRMRRRLRPNPVFYAHFPHQFYFDEHRVSTRHNIEGAFKKKPRNYPTSLHSDRFYRCYVRPVLNILKLQQHSGGHGTKSIVNKGNFMSYTPQDEGPMQKFLQQLKLADSYCISRKKQTEQEQLLMQMLARHTGLSRSVMSTTSFALLYMRCLPLMNMEPDAHANQLSVGHHDSPEKQYAKVDRKQSLEKQDVIGSTLTQTAAVLQQSSQDLFYNFSATAAYLGLDKLSFTGHRKGECVNTHPAILHLIRSGESLLSTWNCKHISGMEYVDAVLFICSHHAYLLPNYRVTSDDTLVDVPIETHGLPQLFVPITCSFADVRDVRRRRYLLQDRALELFSGDGNNFLLSFEDEPTRDNVYTSLCSLSPTLAVNAEDSIAGVHRDAKVEQFGLISSLTSGRTITQRWEVGEISNFHYIMSLNTLAGRTYNDLNQYPVFPWILRDYTSEHLDLSDSDSFRDLSKPMGAQTESRAEEFRLRYDSWDSELADGDPPFHYGTHYSSAAVVSSYLIRLEPFTKLFLSLQGGFFDHPDRLFHSIQEAWESASEKSHGDVKELIPEFFYLPEFLVNNNAYQFCARQNGVYVDDVVLPPWAKGDPREFIRLHRAALESDYVSEHLHEWIDLIFGYKQRGQEAVDSLNVFHHLTYEGAVDIDVITDKVERTATIDIINNFGQTPKQLFKRPHPRKRNAYIAISTRALTAEVNFNNLVMCSHPLMQGVTAVGDIIELENGKLMTASVGQVLLPPDYQRCLDYCSGDGTLISMPLSKVTGKGQKTYYEGLHQGPITATLVPRQDMVITAGEDTTIRVWNFAGLRGHLSLKKTLFGHSAAVTCLAAANNFHILVSGSADGMCIVWDLVGLKYVRQLHGHRGPIKCIAVNTNNGHILMCAKTEMHLWDLNGSYLARSHSNAILGARILSCCVSQGSEWCDSSCFVTGHDDGKVRFWSLKYEKATNLSDKDHVPVDSKKADKNVLYNNDAQTPSQSVDVAEDRISDRTAKLVDRAKTEKSSQNNHQWSLPEDKSVGTFWVRDLQSIATLIVPAATASNVHVTAVAVNNSSGMLYTGDSTGRVHSWSLVEAGRKADDHWVKDSAVITCMNISCQVRFTPFERRHHCRNCGGVFCHKCSCHEAAIPSLQIVRPVRVCDKCYAALRQQIVS